MIEVTQEQDKEDVAGGTYVGPYGLPILILIIH